MPVIELETPISADIEICFDLSRSINFHQISTLGTNEKAIAGVTNGLINLNECVTWQATHFGIKQQLTSKITIYNKPFHFRDEQQKGIFKLIIHDHYFTIQDNVVIMKDVFFFQSPLGYIGSLVDKFILTRYLTKFLKVRNSLLKEYAETTKWKQFLEQKNT